MSDIKVGDEVEITYRGVVEATASPSSFRMDGAWHRHDGPVAGTVKVITPALEIGWHRVEGLEGHVTARHWDGERWGSFENRHPTGRSAYRSVEFLGGGASL